MGIYIPNIEKPKVCHECIAFRYEQGDYEPNVYCEITKKELFDAKAIPTYCPLIDIVTCGECKWSYIDEQYEGTLWCKVHFHHYRVNGDGFCNYGERANNTRTE